MEPPYHMMLSQIVEALVQSVPAHQEFVLVGLLHRTAQLWSGPTLLICVVVRLEASIP